MFYSLAQVHYKRADNVTSVKFSNINLFKINCTQFGRIRYLHNLFTVKIWFNVTPFLWPLINRLFSFNNVISISKRCATQKIFFEYLNHSGHLVWINTHIPNKKNITQRHVTAYMYHPKNIWRLWYTDVTQDSSGKLLVQSYRPSFTSFVMINFSRLLLATILIPQGERSIAIYNN